MENANTPVLIGAAQITWRERNAERTPLDALEAISLAALNDCGSTRVRGTIDAVAAVPFLLTQVPELAALMPHNIGAALADRLGISAAQYGAVAGGNLPQEYVNKLAAAVVSGQRRMVLICGTELLNSFLGGLRAGEPLADWSTGREDQPTILSELPDAVTAGPEYAHGLREPKFAYPLIESALRAAKGMGIEAHRQQLGDLLSAMSRVAAANPNAWKQVALTPEQVLSTANGNRMISHPYTKVMNANPNVDMAAGVLLTTAATAQDLGVPQERWVYLWGGADAHDTWSMSERAALHQSPALAAAARATLASAAVTLDEVTLFDLYSCFPSAVHVACDALGLAPNDPRGITVTGGLTLFGGPGNNYSLHAIAELVQRLRNDRDGLGLLTANGGYLTKHSVGLYAAKPPHKPWRPHVEEGLQKLLDDAPHPRLVAGADGPLRIDAYTVTYRGAEPDTGIVLGTLENGDRCLAHTDAAPEVFERLLEEDCVGVSGSVARGEATNRFRF